MLEDEKIISGRRLKEKRIVNQSFASEANGEGLINLYFFPLDCEYLDLLEKYFLTLSKQIWARDKHIKILIVKANKKISFMGGFTIIVSNFSVMGCLQHLLDTHPIREIQLSI